MSFCLRNRITVIIITLVLAALSVFGIMRTPVDVFPELFVPRVTIQTEAGGLTAEEVDASTNTMGASIFKRTYLGIDRQGRFGIFWDYVLGVTRSRTQIASPAYSVKDKISFAFAPGVIYFPMNNISVQANISIADLSYASTTAYEDSGIVGTHKGWRAQAGLNILNLNFGLTIHL